MSCMTLLKNPAECFGARCVTVACDCLPGLFVLRGSSSNLKVRVAAVFKQRCEITCSDHAKPTWLPSACTLSTARPSAHLHTLNILGAVCLGAAACAGAADTAGLCQAALLLIRQWQEHAAGAGWCRFAAGSGAASTYCRVTRVREAPSDAGECLYSA